MKTIRLHAELQSQVKVLGFRKSMFSGKENVILKIDNEIITLREGEEATINLKGDYTNATSTPAPERGCRCV